MPVAPRAVSTTLFGSAPSETFAPSQGSITFYTDVSCTEPLSDDPSALLLADCRNAPISGIQAVTINRLPECPNFGTPLLIVSDKNNCKASAEGSGADGGVVGECMAYSSGVDIGSAHFVCYGSGIEDPAAPTTTTKIGSGTTSTFDFGDAATSTAAATTVYMKNDDDDGNQGCCACDSCCCCCVVM